MNREILKERINQIISLTDDFPNHLFNQGGLDQVKGEKFLEFRTAALSFINNLYGTNHSYYKEFEKKVIGLFLRDAEYGRGILKAIKTEIEGNYIFRMKDLISSEIFSDFMEMAKYLLDENYKDAAAVIIGSTLEENLRQICIKNSIEIDFTKDNKIIAKNAEKLNNELYIKNIYNKAQYKQITAWLDLRNQAAHGKYSEYGKEEIYLMYQGISNFVNK